MRQQLPSVCCAHNPLHFVPRNTAYQDELRTAIEENHWQTRRAFLFDQTEISHMSKLSRESYLELKDLFRRCVHNA